jgi:hypothetical protein
MKDILPFIILAALVLLLIVFGRYGEAMLVAVVGIAVADDCREIRRLNGGYWFNPNK